MVGLVGKLVDNFGTLQFKFSCCLEPIRHNYLNGSRKDAFSTVVIPQNLGMKIASLSFSVVQDIF